MKRKFTFLLMALLALAGFKSWGQETLTVCEGNATEQIVPVFVNYFDTEGTISQYVIPSSELTAMTGGEITALKFYIFYVDATTLPSVLSSAQVTCKLQEVSSDVVSSIQSGGTQVFSGNLTASNSCQELDCIFDNAYTYQGGNLLVSFEVTTDKGGYTWTQFFGINPSYNSAITNKGSDPDVPQKFIPKTTFTYTPAPSCPAPTGLAASNITATGATISWTDNDAESYDVAYGPAATFDLSNLSTYTLQKNLTTTSVQLSGLTAETEYKCAVKAHCSGEEESAWSDVVKFTPSATQHLTANDGTETNEYVPFYGWYADQLTKSQFIIPASELTDMQGGSISIMEFYLSSNSYDHAFKGSWNVYFKEVDYTTMPGSYDESFTDDQKVYTGTLSVAGNKMVLRLDTQYEYGDGNLMVYFKQTSSGGSSDYSHTYWYGVNPGYNTAYAGYNNSNSNYKFLPKTSFTYTSVFCPAPKGLAASDITKTGATISWIDNDAETYDLAYGPAATFDLKNSGTYTLVTGLTETSKPLSGLTIDTEYKCAVKAHCSVDDESAWSSIYSFTPTDKLTVYNDTQHASFEYMPFYGSNVHNSYTKSEMIYPASDLQSLSGKTIYYLTFYASVSDHDFGSDAWDIYVKEVNYSTPGGGAGYSYTDDYPSMTKVYSGPLSIVDHKMLIILSTPFVYNSQNLMICFQQTNHVSGTNTNLSWDGVLLGGSSGSPRSRGGFTDGSTGNASSPFLPKTTFTYIPSVTYTINLTHPVTGGTISADYEQAAAGTTVTLSATPATGYEIGEWTVINSTTTEEITVTNNQFIMPESDVTVSAVFSELTAHTVTIAAVEGGTISVSADGQAISTGASVYPGTTLTFGNTPTTSSYQPLFKLDHYVVTEEGSSPQHLDAGVNTYTMPNCNLTVSAVFIPLYFPTLNVTGYFANVALWAGMDNVNVRQVGGQYLPGVAAGEYVFINAEDIEGYRKTVTWSDSQGQYETIAYPGGDSRPCFVMPADGNVTVNVQYAVIQKYNIVLDYNTEGGSITVSQSEQVAGGTLVHIYIGTPNLHFSFNASALSVTYNEGLSSVAVTTVTEGSHYQFSMPEGNVTVHAEYTEDENYAVSIVKPDGCDFDVSYQYQGQNETTGNVYCGYKVYLENRSISSGYRFDGWNVTYKDSEENDQPVDVTEQPWQTYFVMPQGPVTITADVTKLEEHNVTIVQTMGGTITVNGNSESFQALEGSTITMSYSNLLEGYIFDSWIIKTDSETHQTTNSSFSMLGEDLSVEAVFLKESIVNDGSDNNYYIPFHQTGYQWDGSGYNYVMTRSQFIIPATDLENVYDASITDMTFYTNNNTYAFDATWKVYVKEVEYTQFEETHQYEDVTNMTQVYNGTMTIENNKMKVHFDTPYQYNDGNLMISFVQQTTNTAEPWTYWYGVYSTNYSDRLSFGGYGSINFYSNFLPKTKFSYKPSETPTERYEITVNEVEGTTLSASRNLAAAGTVITLTEETSNEYIFNGWEVTSELGDVTVDENNQFTMPAANVTVSANVTPKQHYFVTLDEEMTNGTLSTTPESEIGYIEGTTVTIENQPNAGYKFDESYGVKAWKADDPTTEVEVTTDYYGYNITMPEYNIVISARFIPLTEYTITYHVNGVETPETVYENERIQPSDPQVPAGTSFVGWATSDIATYSETEPTLFETGDYPTSDMELYAVLSYSEQIPATGKDGETWKKLTSASDLKDGDEIVFVEDWYGSYYIMCGRRGQYYQYYNKETVNVNSDEISDIKTATVFTANYNTDCWKFSYYDEWKGETTIAISDGYNLGPQNLWYGVDTWNVEYEWGACFAKNTYYSGYYVAYNDGYFGAYDYNGAMIFKKYNPFITNTYYMTEVLTDGEVAANTTAKNIIITEGIVVDNNIVLTMNENGLFRNENAANFVFEDGAEFIYTGEETVNATFEKDIIGYNSVEASDGWYFIANPTDNTTVNLSGGNLYDLYTFNPAAAAEWHNVQYNDGTQIPEGDILISRKTGYLYANAANFTLKFEGELIPSGEDQTIDLVYYDGGESGREFPGFNLIGNPFPCTAYISSDFDLYKLVNGSEVQISDDYTVAPCEAFFVEATEVGEIVTLSTTAPEGKSRIMPIVVNSDRGETLDRAILHLEGTRNSHKFMMNPDRTNISFAKNGERFASVSRGDETEIPMNFTADHKGSYTISFNTENFEEEYLHLIDVISGDNIDLLVTPSYTFEADADEYASRFRIVFGTTDINDDPATSSEPFVYISNGNLVINNVEGTASMQIVDMLGRIVRTETVCGSYNKPHNLKAGAYVITLDGRSQRIVIE